MSIAKLGGQKILIIMGSLVGDNLKKLRKLHKLSQEKMANILNIKRSTYSNWESGQSDASIKTLYDICNRFDLDIRQLYEDFDNYDKNIDLREGENKKDGKIYFDFFLDNEGKKKGKISGKISIETTDFDTWLQSVGLENELKGMSDLDIKEWAVNEIQKIESKGLKTNILEKGLPNSYLWLRVAYILVEMNQKMERVVADL